MGPDELSDHRCDASNVPAPQGYRLGYQQNQAAAGMSLSVVMGSLAKSSRRHSGRTRCLPRGELAI